MSYLDAGRAVQRWLLNYAKLMVSKSNTPKRSVHIHLSFIINNVTASKCHLLLRAFFFGDESDPAAATSLLVPLRTSLVLESRVGT